MRFRKTLSNVPKKYTSFYRRRKKTTILLTILGAGLLIYGSLILFETIQFKLAERKINSVYSQLLREFPEHEEAQVGGSCGYASAKYSKGLPSCGYSAGLVFYEEDVEVLNEIANKLDGFIRNPQNKFKVKKIYPDQGAIDLLKERPSYENPKSYTFDWGVGLHCSGNIYHVKNISDYMSKGKPQENKYLGLSFSCFQKSFIERYPAFGD